MRKKELREKPNLFMNNVNLYGETRPYHLTINGRVLTAFQKNGFDAAVEGPYTLLLYDRSFT